MIRLFTTKILKTSKPKTNVSSSFAAYFFRISDMWWLVITHPPKEIFEVFHQVNITQPSSAIS